MGDLSLRRLGITVADDVDRPVRPLGVGFAEPLLTGRYGRACLDTVAPLLLLGWGHVGPAFFAQFHTFTPHREAALTLAFDPVSDEASAPEATPATPTPVVVTSAAEELKPAPTPAAASASTAPPAKTRWPSSPRRSPTANRGVPAPSAQGSLGACLTYWLEAVAVHHLRENTHTRYTACVNNYLIPGSGKKMLAKLTAKDVRTWLNQLRTTCQCCARSIDASRDQPRCCATGTCCSKRLSPLTLTYIHSVLKSALEHAVREEEIPRNVARNVRTGTPRPRRFEPLTAEEARQFLATTNEHRLHALYVLALHTGLRKGELLGLHWADLDLDAGTAAIRRTLQRTSRGGLTALPTKTRASERRIALPARCVQSLKLHHEEQQRP